MLSLGWAEVVALVAAFAIAVLASGEISCEDYLQSKVELED